VPQFKAPTTPGFWYLEALVKKDGTTIHTLKEKLWVLAAPSEKELLAQVAQLDQGQAPGTAKILVSSHPSTWGKKAKDIRGAVEKGATLLLNALDATELEAWNQLAWIDENLELKITTGSKTSHFHYWHDSVLFADLDHSPLADHFFAEVMPRQSVQGAKSAQVHANSLGITESGELEVFADVLEWKLGEGRVVIHQYALLSQLNKSPLANHLLYKAIQNS
jgi:hypothetical protein